MRIKSIRLKNLNSLKGDHFVDLTKEPLAGAGLFAITGPTGAGKSTLLDAITLALYGKAARYGNETNPENMMSRHSAECSAEVEFEVTRNNVKESYRAVWKRHRARGKADGALQLPQRYIYNAKDEVLTQKLTEAEAKIEELLGLNYERFLRSVLLAQGEFSKFLKSTDNERAALLESLTGTEIYSELSKLAYEEANIWENALREKEAAIGSIEVMDSELRATLEAEIIASEDRLKSRKVEIEKNNEILTRITRLETARNYEASSQASLKQVMEEKENAKSELAKLSLHLKTKPFSKPLADLESALSALDKCKGDESKAKEELNEKTERLQELIFRLRTVLQEEIKNARGAKVVAEEESNKHSKLKREAEAWLASHKADENLTEDIGKVIAKISNLTSTRAAIRRIWQNWAKEAFALLPKEADSLPKDASILTRAQLKAATESFLTVAQTSLKSVKDEILQADIILKEKTRELEKAKLLAGLSHHRNNLKEGEECPLCGALDHPFSGENLKNENHELFSSEETKPQEILNRLNEDKSKHDQVIKRLTDTLDELMSSHDELTTAEEETASLITPLGITVPVSSKEQQLQETLQERCNAYGKKVAEKNQAISDIKIGEETLKGLSKSLEKYLQEVTKHPQLAEGVEFDPLDTEDLPSFEEAQEQYDNTKTYFTQAEADVKSATNALKNADATLNKYKSILLEKLKGSAFENENALLAAVMDENEAGEIARKRDELEKRQTEQETLCKNATEIIASLLKEKTLEGEAAQEVKDKCNDLKAGLETLIQDQTTRKNRKDTDNGNIRKRAEHQTELYKKRKEMLVWHRLSVLIGSRDGAKFRKFAQTISLDILTRHANKHLVRLSDRYRIRREAADASKDDATKVDATKVDATKVEAPKDEAPKDEAPKADSLNLQIEDLHQASALRPMSSLSGGESFLASLALALGLSDLAGRSIQIDTLFIDEGFGSLDPETLEVAINALESLRQNNKTVGVISHVGLLKERIGTQIIVEKHSGGTSAIRIHPAVAA